MKALIKHILIQYTQNNLPAAAATIAFYALFALAPTLVFATTVLSSILGNDPARHSVAVWVGELIGTQPATMLLGAINNADFVQHGLVPTLISGIMLLWGASTAFVQLRITLNQLFGFASATVHEMILKSIIGRLIAALFAIITGTVLMGGTIAGAVTVYLNAQIGSLLPWSLQIAGIIEHGLAWLLVAVMFTVLLKFLPAKPPPRRAVFVGAIAATLLFAAGKYVIGFYLKNSTIASAYGPGNVIVAVMIWIYYSTQAFLMGAVICRYWMDRDESRYGNNAPSTGCHSSGRP